MKPMKPSKHCVNDRLERITFIATTIGFGEIIKKKVNYVEGKPAIRCLTDTGVIICKTMDEQKVITMFIATIEQVAKIYGKEKIPSWLYSKVKKNKKYMKKQDAR